MKGTEYISHDEIVAKTLSDERSKKAYDLLRPRFCVIRDFINLRSTKGITQKDLARLANTHQSRVSRVESGDYDIRLGTIVALADALDADVEISLVPRLSQDFYFAALGIASDKISWSIIERDPIIHQEVEFQP